jgi:hypothetical protein
MTGLSEATNISTAPKTVFAIGTREARGVEMDTCPFEEDAAIIVEVWAYAPELLSEGASVDPLSLYLSMREDPDERVQTALAQLLEAWT